MHMVNQEECEDDEVGETKKTSCERRQKNFPDWQVGNVCCEFWGVLLIESLTVSLCAVCREGLYSID